MKSLAKIMPLRRTNRIQPNDKAVFIVFIVRARGSLLTCFFAKQVSISIAKSLTKEILICWLLMKLTLARPCCVPHPRSTSDPGCYITVRLFTTDFWWITYFIKLWTWYLGFGLFKKKSYCKKLTDFVVRLNFFKAQGKTVLFFL